MFCLYLGSGQILRHINFAELPVEFILYASMLILLILYLLLYAQIKFGKITVQHTSCLVVAVKFLTLELV